jgi:hypothetical protein
MRQKHELIKRNSSFFNATTMMPQTKKQTQKIILIIGAFFMFSSSICSLVWGLEIRQDLYSYSPAIITPVQIPIHQTFVIERQPSFYAGPESRPLPVVYFELGSAWLSPDACSKLLMDLRECCAACPLYLTGYTCSLGVESGNQKLSRHRAETVAALLRRNGYKVASAEGKGMIYGSNPESNRMVEIKLTKK